MAAGGLPQVGEILGGKYELVRTLGEGGMSLVFEARHRETGQRVAVKVLAPMLANDRELVARFDREARAVKRLRTRHVAHIHDVAKTDAGLPFIVMDFLDGRDLSSELTERQRIPIAEAVDWVIQAAAAMDEAHDAGVIHRDLKPANLFLTDEGTQRCVKVLDFGISKLDGDAAKLTAEGAAMGTVIYMAPEQMKSSRDVDRRADVWSLAVILYELLAGRAPFEGPPFRVAVDIVSTDVPDIRTFAPDIPEPLAQSLARILVRDRAVRPASMRQLALMLAPFVPPGSLGARAAAYLGAPPSHGAAARTQPLQKRPSNIAGGTVVDAPPSSNKTAPLARRPADLPRASAVPLAQAPAKAPAARRSVWPIALAIGAFVVIAGLVAGVITYRARGGLIHESKPQPHAHS